MGIISKINHANHGIRHLRPLFDICQGVKRGALALSPEGLARIHNLSSVHRVSGRDVRRFWRILQFVTDRLQFAGLEKFYCMPCPLHLFWIEIKQRDATVEGRD